LLAGLQEFEDSREADYLERLAVDGDLIRYLQLSGFSDDTEEWKAFALALAEYGYSVFRAWLGTGEIIKKLAARTVRGRSDLPSPFRLTEDEVGELAAELIVRGIGSFRRNVLARGRWQADGGASLKTFFVGHLLFLVPITFRQWRKDAGRELSFDPSQPPLEQTAHGMTPTDRVELRMMLNDVRDELHADLLRMFDLQANGRSIAEIASELGVTQSQVKTDMMRARRRIAERFPEAMSWIA